MHLRARRRGGVEGVAALEAADAFCRLSTATGELDSEAEGTGRREEGVDGSLGRGMDAPRLHQKKSRGRVEGADRRRE